MQRHNSSAFRTLPSFFFLFKKVLKTISHYCFTVIYQAYLISFLITFFKIRYSFAREIRTMITIDKSFFFCTILYFTNLTSFWFICIITETTITWLFLFQMNIAYHAVHSTWGKHTCYYFFWHTHRFIPFLRKMSSPGFYAIFLSNTNRNKEII